MRESPPASVSKAFGDGRALEGVSRELRGGEIVELSGVVAGRCEVAVAVFGVDRHVAGDRTNSP